jgi:hypothetical protein
MFVGVLLPGAMPRAEIRKPFRLDRYYLDSNIPGNKPALSRLALSHINSSPGHRPGINVQTRHLGRSATFGKRIKVVSTGNRTIRRRNLIVGYNHI